MSTQDTTNSVWCFARLFHYPGAELLQAISLYCLRHWHRFKPQELANMIWSLALLRACSPHTWCARLCPQSQKPVHPCGGKSTQSGCSTSAVFTSSLYSALCLPEVCACVPYMTAQALRWLFWW